MANETISFCCPACGIKLTVPASLAGVVGPCPTCRTQIQAPIPAPPVLIPAPGVLIQAPAPAAPAPPPPYSGHGGYVPPYVPPVETSYAAAPAPPVPYMEAAVAPPPTLQSPAQPPVAAEAPGNPAVLKPEPRHLPNRTAPVEVIAKQMPEPSHQGDRRRRQAAPLPRHPKQHGIFARFLMLLVFLILSAALVYGVLTILKRQTESESKRQDPPVSTEKPATTTPPSGESKAPETPVKAALPTPPAAQPTLIEPPPPLPDGVDAKVPAMEALAVLEKFLAAKTLAERMPLIETKTAEAELAASCLANPLPATRNVVIDAQESNPVEGVVDYFYNVDFEAGENRLNPQTMLIRTRGSSPPKVVVDPFLDLFGGRLAAFASKPSDKGADFQVIIYPLPSCTDEKIREREKKLTLKLLARENSKEIAQAYFSKVSKIGEMLVDGTYNLSYGKPKACTVMLRWNTEENKDYPYLEAIDIKALDWNP